jgi:FAD/FMN-containing dehydrogenase
VSKVAEYLQEHIAGEVSVQSSILEASSRDASILEIKPEMVVYPRITSDIRKIARFSEQLAEKGHLLPITMRGEGTDETGAAIGKGIIINTAAHMNGLLEFDPKQKLVRVQPGLSSKSLNDALMLHGLAIPALTPFGTVGGAVANNSMGVFSGNYGDMRAWTHQLEVVLANGDIVQTERVSKRELNRRKGLQTSEGQLYRTIDSLIEDNKQLIEEKIGVDSCDTSGYSAIAQVKQKDGSFDLTPLIVGSQGTLGLISEMILKAEFISAQTSALVAAFPNKEAARDALDSLKQLQPALLEYFDGELFELAAAGGKRYSFYKDMEGGIAAAVVVAFNDFNERARRKKLKKAQKLIAQTEAVYDGAEGEDAITLLAAREVTSFLVLPTSQGVSAPPLIDGAYVPTERFEDFSRAVAEMAAKYHVTLPLHANALTGLVYTRPHLQLQKVSDKQKIFKLIEEYNLLVTGFGGCLVAEGGEGRLKAHTVLRQLDDDVKQFYAAIKAAFDPYNILNPGVKQATDIRVLAGQLRKSYDRANFINSVWYR